MLHETIVGKKGEILPKKKLREAAGIKPGDRVVISTSPGEIHIRKVLSVEEALDLPVIRSSSVEEYESDMETIQNEILEEE